MDMDTDMDMDMDMDVCISIDNVGKKWRVNHELGQKLRHNVQVEKVMENENRTTKRK